MSGHSHWSGIKHKKAVQDAKRAQIFTKLGRAISIAARQGGGKPDFNPALRLAIDKAKEFNMPKDKIENSIRKGTGGGTDSQLEEFQYEALGPATTMLIISGITDNKNRTVSEIRRLLEKHGGKMADGGVSWNFKRVGTIIVSTKEQTNEIIDTAIEQSAEDVVEKEDGTIIIFSRLENFNSLKEALSKFNIIEASVGYIPLNPIKIEKAEKTKYEKLINELTFHPDVQEVFDNLQDE